MSTESKSISARTVGVLASVSTESESITIARAVGGLVSASTGSKSGTARTAEELTYVSMGRIGAIARTAGALASVSTGSKKHGCKDWLWGPWHL